MKPDIDKLLSASNVNSSIIELDNYIGELCNYGSDIDKLTEQQKNFYLNQNLEREVNNGGFNQYFGNSSGNYAHETIKSLLLIGASKTADILQTAINQFPANTVPSDREERQNILKSIEDIANQVWDNLDQKFFAYEDDLNTLNINYVRQNKNAF